MSEKSIYNYPDYEPGKVKIENLRNEVESIYNNPEEFLNQIDLAANASLDAYKYKHDNDEKRSNFQNPKNIRVLANSIIDLYGKNIQITAGPVAKYYNNINSDKQKYSGCKLLTLILFKALSQVGLNPEIFFQENRSSTHVRLGIKKYKFPRLSNDGDDNTDNANSKIYYDFIQDTSNPSNKESYKPRIGFSIPNFYEAVELAPTNDIDESTIDIARAMDEKSIQRMRSSGSFE